jgi:2-iminobutanoate/2-iminopropanoate deaminase
MPDIQPILTDAAPRPAGHYSQAVVHDGIVYVSGQLPIDPARGPRTPAQPLEPIEDQTRRALQNIQAILAAAGCGPARILRCTVYVADAALWPRVNAAYAAFFQPFACTPPARTVVPCGTLHYGYEVEIDAIAALEHLP